MDNMNDCLWFGGLYYIQTYEAEDNFSNLSELRQNEKAGYG